MASYWWALVRATGPLPIVRAATLRLWRADRIRKVVPATRKELVTAATALGRSCPIFAVTAIEAQKIAGHEGPDEVARARQRADRFLAGQIELFGRIHDRRMLDWQTDPVTGRSFDREVPADQLVPYPGEIDPRGAWELARAGHLVELGAAAQLHPDRGLAIATAIDQEIDSFLDCNPLGTGIHWTSPLEVALRSLHWLAALELVREIPRATWNWRHRCRIGAALVEQGRFIATHLEQWGMVSGNHLLGELLGLLAIGSALDGAAESNRWRDQALGRLPAIAEAQVLDDGAHFEGATAYHRFALELLVAADRIAWALGRPFRWQALLGRMFGFVRGYLCPDGTDPGVGDSDEGRALPLLARAPRDHHYLLSLGAALLGDRTLKLPGQHFAAEAIWLTGAAGYRRWRRLGECPLRSITSFPSGGLHVLRGAEGDYALLRAGGHGQRGVGGHTHNDQLEAIVTLGGAPLLIDPGTYCYLGDPLWRDRFRATAAHSTVVIDGQEQAPLFEARPFALPEQGRIHRASAGERDRLRWVVAERRSAAHHVRRLAYDPKRRAVLLTDRITGRGSHAEARYQFGEERVRPLQAADRAIAAWLRAWRAPWAGILDETGALLIKHQGHPWAIFAPLGVTPRPLIEEGWCSPHYGERRPAKIALIRVQLPTLIEIALLLLPLHLRRVER